MCGLNIARPNDKKKSSIARYSKWIYLLSSVLLANTIVGCRKEEEKQKNVAAVISLDWNNVAKLLPSCAAELNEHVATSESSYSKSWLETIDEKEYLVLSLGIETDGSPGKETPIFTIYVRCQKTPAAFEIILSNNRNCIIQIDNFKKGRLKNISTGHILDRPFVFAPGKYHLWAGMETEE